MTLPSFVHARLEILVINLATGMVNASDAFKTLQAQAVETIEKTCSEVVGGIPETQAVQLLRMTEEA